MKDRNGFTLVELLAVIAILAILVIIALPNVINMYIKAQKETFLTEAKKVYSESEKKYLSNVISGEKTKVINSEDSSKLDMTGSKLQYCVILNNSGKVTDMKVSNGKWIASLKDGKTVEDLTIDDLEDGNLEGYNCKQNAPKVPEATNCTFDGDLVQGAKYVNGQYTYRYMQEYGPSSSSKSISNVNESLNVKLMNSSIVPLIAAGYMWNNMSSDGWGVILTDRTSTEPVTSKLCSSISGKPIVSMSSMFSESQAKTLDVSSFDTSNVTNMYMMFSSTKATALDVSNFDTSKVTNMSGMFRESYAKTLDVSSFDTSNVTNMAGMFSLSKATTIDVSNFDTSKVTNMVYMFTNTKATTLDLSNFDTSKVTDMSYMFSLSKATTIDVSNFDTSKVTNMDYMFYNCSNLKTIYASDIFVTNKVTNDNYMFSSPKLVGGAGTIFDNTKTDKTYARIDTATTPGYFTKK